MATSIGPQEPKRAINRPGYQLSHGMRRDAQKKNHTKEKIFILNKKIDLEIISRIELNCLNDLITEISSNLLQIEFIPMINFDKNT